MLNTSDRDPIEVVVAPGPQLTNSHEANTHGTSAVKYPSACGLNKTSQQLRIPHADKNESKRNNLVTIATHSSCLNQSAEHQGPSGKYHAPKKGRQRYPNTEPETLITHDDCVRRAGLLLKTDGAKTPNTTVNETVNISEPSYHHGAVDQNFTPTDKSTDTESWQQRQTTSLRDSTIMTKLAHINHNPAQATVTQEHWEGSGAQDEDGDDNRSVGM